MRWRIVSSRELACCVDGTVRLRSRNGARFSRGAAAPRANRSHLVRSGSSVNARATRAWCALDIHLDAVEQRFERRVVDLHVSRSLGGRWQTERSLIQALVELAHAAAIEEQNLQRVTTAAEKHKQRTAARVVADVLLGKARQSIERIAHVDRLQGHEHLHALRD